MADRNIQRAPAGSFTRRSEPRTAVALGEHGRHPPHEAAPDGSLFEPEEVEAPARPPERTTRRYAHTLQRGGPSGITGASPVIQPSTDEERISAITMPKLSREAAAAAALASAPPRPAPGNPVRTPSDSTALYRRRPTMPALPVVPSDPNARGNRAPAFRGAPTLLDDIQRETPDTEDSPSALPSVNLDVASSSLSAFIPRAPPVRFALPIVLVVAVALIWLFRTIL